MTAVLVVEGAIRYALEQLGVAGVSTVAIVALVTLVVWSSRARAVGHYAGSAVSTTKWVALSLLGLTVLGVATLHPERAVEILEAARGKWDVVARLVGWGG